MPQTKFINFLFFNPVFTSTNERVDFIECFELIRREYQEILLSNDRINQLNRAKKEILDRGLLDEESSTAIATYDLQIQQLKEERGNKLIYRFGSDIARLASITVEQNCYHLTFERLFDNELPIITELSGESSPLEIEQGEYIGNSVSLLYDSLNHLFMIQRNRDSLGPKALEGALKLIIRNYFDEILDETIESFSLNLLWEQNPTQKALNKNYFKTFHLEVGGQTKNNILQNLIRINNDPESINTIEIKIKTGRRQNDSIDLETSRELITEYVEHEDVIKISVRAKDTVDDFIEPIDLLNQKFVSKLEFVIDETRHLNPVAVFESMLLEYTRANGPRDILLRQIGGNIR